MRGGNFGVVLCKLKNQLSWCIQTRYNKWGCWEMMVVGSKFFFFEKVPVEAFYTSLSGTAFS